MSKKKPKQNELSSNELKSLTAKLRTMDEEYLKDGSYRNYSGESDPAFAWIAEKSPAGPCNHFPRIDLLFGLLLKAANCGAFDAPHLIPFKRIIVDANNQFWPAIIGVLNELRHRGFDCWKPPEGSAPQKRGLLMMADGFEYVPATDELSQREFASLVGVDESIVSKRIEDYRPLTVANAKKIKRIRGRKESTESNAGIERKFKSAGR